MASNKDYFSPLPDVLMAKLKMLVLPEEKNLLSSDAYKETMQLPGAHQSYAKVLNLGDMSTVPLTSTADSDEFICEMVGALGHVTDIWLNVTATNTTPAGPAAALSRWWPYLLIKKLSIYQLDTYLFQSYNPTLWFMYTISRLPRELRKRLFRLSNNVTITATGGAANPTQVLFLPLPWSRIWSRGKSQPSLNTVGFSDKLQFSFVFNRTTVFAQSTVTSMSLAFSARTQVVKYFDTTKTGEPVGYPPEAFNIPFENIISNGTMSGVAGAGITSFSKDDVQCQLKFQGYMAKAIFLAATTASSMAADPKQPFDGAFPSTFDYYPQNSGDPILSLSGTDMNICQLLPDFELEPFDAFDIAPATSWTNCFLFPFGMNFSSLDYYGQWFFENGSSQINVGGTFPTASWLTPSIVAAQVFSVNSVMTDYGLTKKISVPFGAKAQSSGNSGNSN